MKLLLIVLLLISPTLRAETLPEASNPVPEYARLAGLAAPVSCADSRLRLEVVVPDGLVITDVAASASAAGRQALYRMGTNQVTEGWNWHPDSAREGEDYYHYKYLPLISVEEPRGGYRSEDKIGTPQDFTVLWRYDYFFAFDNLYDFISRRVDDDAGFVAELSTDIPVDQLGMAVEVRLAAPCTAESTTFWKAIHARPVDFTLKKRYLLGHLEAVVFFDRRTRSVVGRMDKLPLVERRK
jgi:hypothetical protein